MTKFYSEWINQINLYNKSKHKNKETIIIYTREADNELYMGKDIYTELLLT